MELLLVKEELSKLVTDPKPEAVTSEWLVKDGKARAMIGLAVDDSQLVHIIRKQTAKEMWDSLKQIHEATSLSSTLHILRKLCSLRLSEEGDLPEHLNEMTDLENRLEVIGEGLKDRVFMALILSSLPPSYGSLINVIESKPENELTVDFVQSKLRDEWRRRAECNGGGVHSHEKVMKVKPKTTEKKKKGVCHYCQEEGHFRRDCPKLAKGRQEKKKSEDGKANLAAEVPGGMEMCLMAVTTSSTNRWYLDSGATSHMTSDKKLLKDVNSSKQPEICLADGTKIKSSGAGSGRLVSVTGTGVRMDVTLNDVYHVPSLSGNLLSVSKICDLGYNVLFDRVGCKVMSGQEAVLVGERSGGLYRLKQFSQQALVTKAEHPDLCEHLWHRRFGHRDPEAVSRIVREGLGFGLKLKKCEIQSVCGVCCEGKMSRIPFPKESSSKSEAVGDLVHSDLGSPMEKATPSGYRYYMTMVDDYSCYTVVYLLKAKSDAEQKIKEYCAMVKNQFGRAPKVIRTDGGGEYSGASLRSYLAENGIILQQTAPYSPQQNGKAERKNRYEVEMVRCLLVESNLDKKYWGEAICTANYLQNRLPTSAVEKTPYELWHGKKPSYGHLRTFGSEAYVHVPKEKRRKLDRKATKMVFVGYAEGRKAYRFLDTKNDWIAISRDAKFLEFGGLSDSTRVEENPGEEPVILKPSGKKSESLKKKTSAEAADDRMVLVSLGSSGEQHPSSTSGGTDTGTDSESDPDVEEEADSNLDTTLYENASDGESSFNGFPLDEIARRSTRSNKGVAPRRLIEEIFAVGELVSKELKEPSSFKEAVSCKQRTEWKSAMEAEMESHAVNGTWDLVKLPEGRKPVGCRWVFKLKRNANGEVVKYKARLVAQGFSQKFGQDYDEVFAPVTKQTTLRTLLAVASKRNLTLKHFDVKTAYLYGELEEELYMKQPTGFEVKGKETLVCRLRRSIYGLKQSARCWNHRLHSVLLGLGFEQGTADPCFYTKIVNGKRVYLLVYVDDILVGSECEAEIEKIYNALRKEFEMTDLGDLNYFLGLEVTRLDGKYSISLEGYIDRVAERFGLRDAKLAKTPMEEGYTKADDKSPLLEDVTKYRSLVGALLYIAVCARPDIAVSASVLGRCVSAPREADWVAAKRVVRYLKATKNWRLQFGDPNGKLLGYSDADWAGDFKTRKSTTGIVFLYAGAAVSWASRLQNCVTLSSMESEYVALSEGSQEAVWLRKLMEEFGESLTEPVEIMEDNQSCIKFVGSERSSRRSKHIETRECYVKELCDEKVLQLVYCPTEEMVADVLTKPLGRIKLLKFSSMLGLSAGNR